jgi:hypothetical protein
MEWPAFLRSTGCVYLSTTHLLEIFRAQPRTAVVTAGPSFATGGCKDMRISGHVSDVFSIFTSYK